MNPAVKAAYDYLEQVLPHAQRKSAEQGKPITCCEGCSACCYEPAYADRAEVEAMLEILTPEQRAEVAAATQQWIYLATQQSNLIANDPLPDAVTYRSLRIACPFLKNHRCMAYERRPITCRLFMVSGPRWKCEDLSQRRHQEFMECPEAQKVAVAVLSIGLEVYEYDHIGALLAEILLGVRIKSAAHMIFAGEAKEKMARGAQETMRRMGLEITPVYEEV